MSAGSSVRIGLAFDGDVTDRRQWSGTPFGVLGGLREAGVEVVPIDCSLPPRTRDALALALAPPLMLRAQERDLRERARSAYRAARIGPNVAAVQSAVAARRARRLPPLDGIVQIGTGFRLPPVAPIVTYEDMTIAQALLYPYRHWRTLPRRHVERRLRLQQECYAAASGCVMTNSWAAASAREDYGLPGDKVSVAGVGTHEPPRSVQRDWSVPRFLFVGVEWERKNGPLVLAGFRAVRERHPDATLDVVGGHPPIDEPGVIGHGFVRRDDPVGADRLRTLFDRATCFVMPSLFEPSAVVYTEAMACGLPSIGTTVGGSEDIVGNAGVSVDPHDADAVRRAMLELADSETASRLGAVAVERSPAFTWRAVAERLLRAIDPDLLDRPLEPALPG